MKDKLIQEATEARKQAYVPYSNFPVGAAVLTEKGNVYHGCNIENASFSLTCCAERTAIFKAISAGDTAIKALAVIAATDTAISPCGACRQVMTEFFSKETVIYLANIDGKVEETSVEALLPFAFQLK